MRLLTVGVLLLAFVASVSAKDRSATIMADQRPVFELIVPSEAQVSSVKGKTVIQTANMFLHVWSVRRPDT